nr:aldolase/citrate lyase family protein [uncultured Actinoplanes sp.]
MRLTDADYADLDVRLAAHDAFLLARYPGESAGRQPVHTVYLPADRIESFRSWGSLALKAMDDHAFPWASSDISDKLAREPIEDVRVDFEDGFGVRDDDQEDAAVRRAAAVLSDGPRPPFVGIRIKSLEAATRRRALRTLDLFLSSYQDTFVITLPKVSGVDQVTAMVTVLDRLESAYGLAAGSLRFEIQIELPSAILSADGTATVPRLITAAAGRCLGLHYGTYDYSAAVGVAAAHQSLDHPAADHAKAVMQAAAAQTGVRLCDGSTNILPVGSRADVQAAWKLHHRLVTRSLTRGFYQGWDLHPAQLPTRYAATYAFFRSGRAEAVTRLRRYLERREGGIADEPATARALAAYLLRGLDCGALPDAGFPRADLLAFL